jgi:N-acetylglucosaminyldiphosphoundecaprenol N-acetyl-beta-D-mannosaminyltransferase
MALPKSDAKPSARPTLCTNSDATLTRSVYCVLGVPIDAVNIESVLDKIETAVANRATFLISTPNLNFIVNSLSDPQFRETLLVSDLCSADGAPVVWIARLLGLPIKERVAGSDLFERLQDLSLRRRRISVFLFGGARGVAATAATTLNSQIGGLKCVGTIDPGFCEVNEMSQDHVIETINSSGADLLSVSLGAKKGQSWLYHNHTRLTIPVRAHLGAAINFQAGVIKRAPKVVRVWGLEWLWRIKEEHYLWKRYLNDGLVLLRLLLTRVLPLVFISSWHRLGRKLRPGELLITRRDHDQSITMTLCGLALDRNVPTAIPFFREALSENKDIILDLSNIQMIDARFFGLLLMLRKELKCQGSRLNFVCVPKSITKLFRLNQLKFLLTGH